MSEVERPRYKLKRGTERSPNTGFLMRRSKSKITSPKAPTWEGELRIDLSYWNKIVEADGVIRLSGWERRSSDSSGMFFMEIRPNFWKPGDPTNAAEKAEKGAAFKDEPDDIPNDFWEVED